MLLEAGKVSMKYLKSNRLVLHKISLGVSEGDFVAVTGESGSGKSTLLAMLSGILRPIEGTIVFEDKNVAEMNENELADLHRTKIGYVPQSNIMFKSYRILENIILPYSLGMGREYIGELEEKAYLQLKQLGIEVLMNRYPYELSGGELKRVSIARAMLMNPKIIIADEPTTGVDKGTGAIILECLQQYAKDGRAVIVATHDEQVLKYSTRSLEVKNGKIIV